MAKTKTEWRKRKSTKSDASSNATSDDPARMDLAIKLFERGFQEKQIEAALNECTTLEEALRWLSPDDASKAESQAALPDGGKSKSALTSIAIAVSNAPTPHHGMKRRSSMKADSIQAVDAATAIGQSEVEEQQGGGNISPKRARVGSASSAAHADSSQAAHEELAAVSSSSSSSTEAPVGKPLESAADSKQFWSQAAHKWSSAVADLRASGISPLPHEDSKTSQQSGELIHQKSGASQRSDSVGGSTEAEHRDALLNESISSSAAETMPPGTPQPCKEARSSPATSSTGSGLSRRRRSTPASSPRPLKLNKHHAEACAICCNDIPILRAVRLPCSHGWYCASCMLRHTELRLSNGHTTVTCPQCNEDLAERQLRKLLPEIVIERLLARSLEKAVSSEFDLRPCPTPNCPMRVALEDDSDGRFKCPECNQESCLRCGSRSIHKGLTCQEYADRIRQKNLAKGKKQRQELERIEAEESLMQWLTDTGSKQCPTCKIAVTKQNLEKQATQYSECHKMMCRNCNTKFCFKCLHVLTANYACKCTRVDHGFVDPKTGKRLDHLKAPVAPSRGRGRPKGKAK